MTKIPKPNMENQKTQEGGQDLKNTWGLAIWGKERLTNKYTIQCMWSGNYSLQTSIVFAGSDAFRAMHTEGNILGI